MSFTRRSAITLAIGAVAALAPASVLAQTPRQKENRINPILFWNAVALDLVALDHSVEAADARAPGPCASARALGAVHAVIADATHFAYPSAYAPQFFKGRLEREIEAPDLFVGGAAYAMLSYIFDTQMHRYILETGGEKFKKLVGAWASRDWEAGIAFGNSVHFRKLWTWISIRQSLLPQSSSYIPRPRQHNIDPYNAGQGFYGSSWGGYQPLILGARQVTATAPEAPPPEGSSDYEHDLAEVRVKGALQSKGDHYFAARTLHQTNVGLFWAYDGARLLGTPPRQYNQILRQITVQDKLDVVETARLFALCNLAMADAGHVAWWAKYRYNVWRPILGIQNHARTPDPNWLPLGSPKTNPLSAAQSLRGAAQTLMGGVAPSLGDEPDDDPNGAKRERKPPKQLYGNAAFTPNFPSYPSGHAVFGGACFTMVKLLRGERPQTAQNPDAIRGEFVSDELNGVSLDHFRHTARPFYPIAYNSLDAMIDDNALSRVYLGVHWRFDCTHGSASGARIARAVYEAAYDVYDAPNRNEF